MSLALSNYDLEVNSKIESLEEQLEFLCKTFEQRCVSLMTSLPARVLKMSVTAYSKSLTGTSIPSLITLVSSELPSTSTARVTRSRMKADVKPNLPQRPLRTSTLVNLPETPLKLSSRKLTITRSTRSSLVNSRNDTSFDQSMDVSQILSFPVEIGTVELDLQASPSQFALLDVKTKEQVKAQVLALQRQLNGLLTNL